MSNKENPGKTPEKFVKELLVEREVTMDDGRSRGSAEYAKKPESGIIGRPKKTRARFDGSLLD